MQNVASLEKLTLKELGAIASAAQVPRWSRLKKTELLARLQKLGAAIPTLDEALKIRAEKRAAAIGAPSVVAPLIAAVELENQRKSQEKKTKETNPTKSAEISKTSKKTSRQSEKNAPQAETEPAVQSLEKPKQKSKTTKKAAPKTEIEPETPNATPQKADSEPNEAISESQTEPQKADSEPRADAPPTRVSFLKEKMRRHKALGRETDRRDRLVLTVCDAHWLRACWEITPRLVERIRSAMGRHWHTADPTLRLYKIDREPQGATRREFVADVPIRGGVDNWYVDVDDPPSAFFVELGYLARDKQFFTLISSNVVETPRQSVVDAFGRPTRGAFDSAASGFAPAGYGSSVFADAPFGFPPPPTFEFETPRTRVRSRSEKRETPQNSEASNAPQSSFGDALDRTYRAPNDAFSTRRNFRFEVDAEIVVKGVASPGAQIRVKEETVRVDANGAFAIRFRLPERRHVFPVVATSADGVETQTIVLAVDRNTKTLESTFKEDAF